MLNAILSSLSAENSWRDKIHCYESVTSTNDVLKQMARQGAPHGTVLVADSQSAGRGRLGRAFVSPANMGVYMSVLLRPACGPTQLMHLTCAAACAACSAIESVLGFRPGVKWANDLVYQKKKLAGILTELGFHPDGSVAYCIIGIGVNCNQQLADFPPQIRQIAGSLTMVTGSPINRGVVAAGMIDSFAAMNEVLLKEKGKIMTEYRKDCITIGQQISLVRGERIRHGKALDVDGDGALIVEYPDGSVEAVNSGEVSVRGLYNYI